MARKSPKAKTAKQAPPAVAVAAVAAAPQPKAWAVAAIAMAIFAAGLAPYLQTAWFDFVNFDDPVYIYRNPHVLTGLTFENIRWALTTDAVCNWHPLTWISLQLDVSLFGAKPGAHHLVNALIHALNSALLFLVWRATLRAGRMPSDAAQEEAGSAGMWACAWIAALFALHPLHVESVAWISERKDVLSGLFWILCMGAYAWYVRRPGAGRMALTAALFGLGLMAKPMLVTLPAALLLIDYWPLRRMNDSRSIVRCAVEKIPFFVLAAVSSIITFIVQRGGGGVVTVDAIPVWARFANVPVAYVRYLMMTVWPGHLGVFYPHLRAEIPLWQSFFALVALAGITLVLVAYGRKRPCGLVGWLWYLGTLVPVIGIVQVGDQALADRYTYIPHIGIFFGVAWLLLPVLRKHGRVAACAACAMLAVLGVRTYVQVGTWRDTITMFEHSLRVAPDNYRAHKGLGVAYTDTLQQYDKALEHCDRAIALDPSDATLYYNRGNALMGLAREEDAVASYRQALRLDASQADAHFNLGIGLARLKRYDEAETEFRETLRFDPNRANAYNNLGSTLFMGGRYEPALEQYRRALTIQPNDVDAWCNVANVLTRLGKTAEARDALAAALRIDPRNARANEALKSLSAASADPAKPDDPAKP